MPKQKQGFSYVEEKGFVSLHEDVKKGAGWADIDTTAYEDPSQPAQIPLYKQPFQVQAKARLIRAILGLLAARGLGVLDILDASWDKVQRNLFYTLSALLHGADPAKAAAAQKIMETPGVLLGEGLAQTKLPYEKEVDFGRDQLVVLRRERAPEISTTGIGEIISAIEATTEALAKGLGRGAGQVADESKSRQDKISAATRECRQACNFAHGGLLWHLAQPENTKEDKKFLGDLLATLNSLLGRYAVTVEDKEDEQDEEEVSGEDV